MYPKVYEAIVISEDHYNALGIIRSLGEKNIPINLILTTKHNKTFVDKSKYVSKTIFTLHNEDNIIGCINELSKDKKTIYLFPLSDYAALILDKNQKKFGANIICPGMDGKIELYQDKIICKELAMCCDLKTADYDIIVKGVSNNWNIYPAIVKPVTSLEGKKSDITIVKNEIELKKVLNKFWDIGYDRVLVEKFIHGDSEHMVEVMGCSNGKKVFFAGIIKKIREFPMERGSTSFAEIVEEHQDISFDKIENFIKKTRFIGLFDIEFKFVKGTSYFIECNFRNGAPGYAFTLNGINLPFIWINMMENENSFEIKKKKFLFMVEQMDIMNVFKGNVSFIKWIKDFFISKKLFFCIKDIKPVIIYYYQFILSRFKMKKG